MFAGWGGCLRPGMEGWAALPRGRGMRWGEAVLNRVTAMVEDYLAGLMESDSLLEKPYALYGHSLGALVAFEVARRLEASGVRRPQHLFVGAAAAPLAGPLHSRLGAMEDAEFVEAVQGRYQGIPAEVMAEPDLMAMMLPVLRADFEAYENYRYDAGAKVGCGITAFAGVEDEGATLEVMRGWGEVTEGGFDAVAVAGGHFFLNESRDVVVETIRATLRP